MGNDTRKKIKVARIIARMNTGGPAVQVSTLSGGLDSERFESLLLTGRCEVGESDYLELNNLALSTVEVPSLGRRISLAADLRALLFIMNQLKRFDPDIVHTHTFKAGLLGRFALIFIRSRAFKVHTYHGHLLEGYFSRFKLQVLLYIERFLGRRTDVLISVGERVKRDLLLHGIGTEGKFRVIPPGFDLKCNPKRKHMTDWSRNSQDIFRCAWVGRMVQIKQPERVLEIARLIKNKGSKIQIVVVGDGPLGVEVRNLAKKEGLPIEFLGWRSDIHAILLDIEVLILTSSNEGTPISIIEAQRMGVPVLATDVGSVSEVLLNGESGFAMEYSAENFFEKLELLSGNSKLYRDFSRNALSFASNRFTAERLVKDHAELYESLFSELN